MKNDGLKRYADFKPIHKLKLQHTLLQQNHKKATDMSRRKKNVSLFEILMEFPWWITLIAGTCLYLYHKTNPGPTGPTAFSLEGAYVTGLLLKFLQWMCFAAAFVSGLNSLIRKLLFASAKDIEAIRAMSWQHFEKLVAEAYCRQGYRVQETGGGGADGGIDLLLHGQDGKVIVQCKQWKTFSVGVKVVREMFGVMVSENADRVIIVTSGTYTQEAINFAHGKPIELIDGKALVRLIHDVKGVSAPRITDAPAMATHEVPRKEQGAQSPLCPTCGSQMVLRTAKKGANAGNQFWGCPKFPKCRGTRLVD